MSAIRGAKTPELPMPIKKFASAKTKRLGASPEPMNPTVSDSVETMSGPTMPKRSTRPPMATAPMPNPIMLSV
jgi:hypothetical protein